ncbi:MAG TPA: prepilin-type N-terminal cleavage/methylation domain-containing protein [Gemmatimonadales bacterium]|nr:prepilin-type N-terminal cleavage/methylation domain-containing protein [Gemmatimonadales bacterium]
MKQRNEGGFTILEIMIAVVILMVGVLGLVMTAALTTRMMGRANRAQAAAAYASKRMELMRTAACIVGQRNSGVDTLYRGSSMIAYNTWNYTDMGSGSYRLRVITRWETTKNQMKSDTLEQGVPCRT